MKPGDILEGYHGKFAKVVSVVEEGGLYTLSAWVNTKDAAEAETIGVITLNAFGISQVVSGSNAAPEAEVTTEDGTEAEVTSRAAKKSAK